MLPQFCRVFLCVACAFAAQAQDRPSLGLMLRFDHAPSAVFVRTMEQELTSILSPAVFNIHWATGKDPNAYSRALVITFRGTCRSRLELPAPRTEGPVTLAQTESTGRLILPFSEIDCDHLRAFLGATAESTFGRATGRVLAHELYHFLLQTRVHSKKGIAKAVHTPAALVSQSLRFEDGELEKIRSLYR